ncbi:MAG: hypothetical protein U0894_19630 [Pirellulales bacterium]
MYRQRVVVILDHAIRGILWPQSVFGIASGAEWRLARTWWLGGV